MKTIELTQGQVARVDDCDYEKANQFKWHAYTTPKDHTFYAAHNLPRVNGHQMKLLLHRFILGITDPKVRVDHKNRNGLDCQRNNLRVATTSQNGANRKINANSQNGFKGLRRRPNGKWQSSIHIKGIDKFLGTFTDKILAARRYDAAAIEAFGKFACTNVMLGLLPAEVAACPF